MKNFIIAGAALFVCLASFAQQKQEPGKLVKQEVVEGKKVCHYSDGSRITMKTAYEACSNVWRLID